MAKPVLFDVTRLLQRWDRQSPTGIDRVVLAYARWLLHHDDVDVLPVANLGGHIARLPVEQLDLMLTEAVAQAGYGQETRAWRSLLPALRMRPDGSDALRSQVVRTRWDGWMNSGLVAAVKAKARPLGRFARGSMYVNVGHSGLDRPALLAQMVKRGARPIVLIHDLIPINFPEFCGPRAADRHERRMAAAFDECALIIANSQCTAQEIETYAQRVRRAAPAVCVAPLGLEQSFLEEPPRLLPGHPYFVCVGTIEARKNLTFLLALWRRLAERLGPQAPRLVLVGRRGWENESVLDHLERSPAVRALVHEVSDLRDAEVACLVRGANALLAPSFAEGFDLPVIEAMALSTPVIASDISVHRELAVGATLLDPMDGAGWFSAIEAATWHRPAAVPFAAPTWEQHFSRVGPAMGLGMIETFKEPALNLVRV